MGYRSFFGNGRQENQKIITKSSIREIQKMVENGPKTGKILIRNTLFPKDTDVKIIK